MVSVDVPRQSIKPQADIDDRMVDTPQKVFFPEKQYLPFFPYPEFYKERVPLWSLCLRKCTFSGKNFIVLKYQINTSGGH